MTADPQSAPPPKQRRTAFDRLRRREAIFERLQQGWSYEAIARAHGLTRERIRQIIVKTIEARSVDPTREHLRLQLARLDPALRLAAQKVMEGDLRGVDRLVRVLDRLDRYQRGAAQSEQVDDGDEARARLRDKINGMVDRQQAFAAAAAGPAEFAENAVSKFFPRQVVELAHSGQK